MATTTIRVDVETRQALIDLAAQTGDTLMDTTRAAAEALRRQRFAQRVVDEISALRSDTETWAEYLADAERSSVRDGVG